MSFVSVILPCYNGERWIKETIESVLAQTYVNFELLIIDDGSTDSSKEIIKSFETDKRLHYINQSNRGFSAAINRGIKESHGYVLGFIGQDDLWLPDKLELQIKYLQKHSEIDIVYSNYFCIDSNGEFKGEIKGGDPGCSSREDLIIHLFLENFVGFETVLIKKRCISTCGYFDERMVAFSDHDLWLRVMERFNIGYLDENLVKKRIHELQLSKTRIFFAIKDEFLIIKKATALHPFLKNAVKKKLMSLHYSLGVLFLTTGNRERAKQELLESFKCQPWAVKSIGVCLSPYLYKFMVKTYKKTRIGTYKILKRLES
jgi:glycosyltransferase involved in cell wall biosynthesis